MQIHRPHASRMRRAAAFTLIEMLVAVGLVMLMLLLFAQIFGTAVSTMRRQQATAQNDQKARSVENILRSDLAKMTCRQPRVRGIRGLVPLTAVAPVDDERQRGYFAISENDIGVPDDVLSFTIDLRPNRRDPVGSVVRGRAQSLGRPDADGSGGTYTQGGSGDDPSDSGGPDPLSFDRNEPDYDDGIYGNGVGESHTAEVCYFQRGGNLYRRVLLVREPQPSTTVPNYPPAPALFSPQPGVGINGASIIGGNVIDRKFMRYGASYPVPGDYVQQLDFTGTTPAAGDFWGDFDYAAWNRWIDLNGSGTQDAFPTDEYVLMFHGDDSLQNNPAANSFPLGNPQYRFGHRPAAPDNLPLLDPNPFRLLAGQPFEYLTNGYTPVGFIGRFTHEETSNLLFGWPGLVPNDPASVPSNPLLRDYLPGWDVNQNSIVDDYEGGPRAGEDLLLGNVESFDVQVWDDGFAETDINGNGVLDPQEDINGNGVFDELTPQWVELGHRGVHPLTGVQSRLGWFNNIRNQNRTYGPRDIRNILGPDGAPGVAGVDDDGNGSTDTLASGALDTAEIGWPGSDDVANRVFDTWHPRADVGAYTDPGFPQLALLRSAEPPFGGYRIRGWVGSHWAANWPMFAGHYIFPGVAEDMNFNRTLDAAETDDGDGVLSPSEDVNGNNALDPPEDVDGDTYLAINDDLNHNGVFDWSEDRDADQMFTAADDLNNSSNGYFKAFVREDWSYYYKVVGYRNPGIDFDGDGTVSAAEAVQSGNHEPEWPREPGATVADGNVIWQCFDNRVSLQMIRITIRYRDVGSGQPRQLTLIHSFAE